MNLEQTQYGYEIRTPDVTIFFGGTQSNIQNLSKAYPDYQLMRLKQIHSDSVVASDGNSIDYSTLADAHFTKDKKLALCVITADCVPLFLYDSETKLISGVHAGWRGVASKIIPKAIQTLIQHGAKAQNITAIIGPHIQKNSFEVGNDVRDKILSSIRIEKNDENISAEYRINEFAKFYVSLPEQKSLVDLNLIVRTQLEQQNINLENVFDLHIDTVQNKDFHSYRRDKENSGRQISFICRTL
ncbi:MAG: peptidoglycan editing factor PgeF [Bdellovibrio sp.]